MIEELFLILVFLFSIVLHEVSHGTVAFYLGDPTAKEAGRLTLNPLKHLDPFGSIILPFFLFLMTRLTGQGIIFGWAKPVPINPFNFRDQKYGAAKVALAGPASNLLVALVFGLALRFFPGIWDLPALSFIFGYIVFINLLLAIFNLIPIPPLDGSHILFAFLPPSMTNVKMFLTQFSLFLLLLIIFLFFDLILLLVSFLFFLIVGTPFF